MPEFLELEKERQKQISANDSSERKEEKKTKLNSKRTLRGTSKRQILGSSFKDVNSVTRRESSSLGRSSTNTFHNSKIMSPLRKNTLL